MPDPHSDMDLTAFLAICLIVGAWVLYGLYLLGFVR